LNESLQNIFSENSNLQETEQIQYLSIVNKKLTECFWLSKDFDNLQKTLEECFLISVSNPLKNATEIFYNIWNYAVFLIKSDPEKVGNFLGSLGKFFDVGILGEGYRMEILLLRGTAFTINKDFVKARGCYLEIYDKKLGFKMSHEVKGKC
jgi:hypothetical protein